MNKASMILDICNELNINYTPSMHNMSLKELTRLHDRLVKKLILLKELED